MKRLIVNGDDLGYARGVNAGILRAHRDGILTSSTLMVNAPYSEAAAALARATPTLAVGVHLVITYGRPLSHPADVPSLVGPDGAFLRPRDSVLAGRARTEDALREFRAQYARAHELLGREPTHLDAHHWVEEEPAVRDAFLELARETGAAVRAVNADVRERARAAGVRTTDGYSREFQHAGHIEEEALLTVLAALEDGVMELGCHPGEPDPELERVSSYARERVTELATLTARRVRREVEHLGIELTSYAALA